MEYEILSDLVGYLGNDYDKSSEFSLRFCVKRAVQSFKNKRRYPSNYSEEAIQSDMERFKMCIFDLALYWYNMQGVEFQKSHSENNTSRSWSSESDIYAFHNVIPFSTII